MMLYHDVALTIAGEPLTHGLQHTAGFDHDIQVLGATNADRLPLDVPADLFTLLSLAWTAL
jgi:hypothetical protein